MKKIYFLLFVLFGLNLQAQIINFPDSVFKLKLKSWGVVKDINGYSFVLDANGDGEIEVSEALNVYEINTTITNSNIFSNTSGIEHFINLTKLNISNNQLVTLDVSSLTSLKELNCKSNQISNINVNGLINLERLLCDYNQLTNISLIGLTNLNYFSCSSNLILDLNISNLPNLQEIYGSGFGNISGYKKLTLSNLPSLITLNCSGGGSGGLNELNMSYVDNLQNIDSRLTALITIDVSMLPNLQSLNVVNCYNLVSIFAKNGSNETISFGSNLFTDNLKYFCVDEFQLSSIQYLISIKSYMTNCHTNTYCDFVFGGEHFITEGNTKYDFNANGCDTNDIDYSNLNFSITNGMISGTFITNQSGNYSIPVQSGSHTITPNLENPTYFNISPTSLTVDFPTQASPFTQDFCVTANGVHSDLEVVVLPTVPARPGFDAKYKISYRNKGNQVENGSVSLTFDDTVLDYISSNPVFESQTVNTFTWNYSNLQPFETREIEVALNVNSPMETPAINNGDILNYSAVISTSNTDETPNDNTFTLNQTVVGSYDPNDKTCLEGETVGPDMIGEYVHYLIRFENTGTYPAENVVVKDMIDLTKFDLATLIPLKGSHEFYTRIKDNKVEFIFENINLDFNDATNDGYVAFKIKTKPTLALGDTFSNNANIYFDYNFPITTNTYTTTIQALSIQDFDFSSKFTLYPNPVQDVLYFNLKENITIQSVEIYNMLGQVVLTVPNATKSVDVSNLIKGNYFVKVNTEKGSSNTKFVKK